MSHKVAVITGAAQGIGRAIALRLADDGLDVVLNDLPARKEQLDALVADISAKGRRGLAVVGDVSSEADVDTLVATAVAEMGGLDVMVANAGLGHIGPLVSTSVAEWDRIQAVNVRGVFLCYKAAAVQMIRQGRGGRIIGGASIASKNGATNWSAYCASKFAVRGLTQSISGELGPHRITVNAYAPGIVDTPLWDGINETCQKQGLPKVPLASMPVIPPDHIAGLVSYLVKDEASFITGQSLNINGGLVFD